MTQAEVRRMFIQHNPGVRRWGMKGYWYRCSHCGNWCGRAGGEKAKIPDYMKMEVDHIRPWIDGGSDALWNLQPLCKSCNRSKSSNATFKDSVKMVKNDLVHGDLVKSSIKKSARNNKLLKALGLTKRR